MKEEIISQYSWLNFVGSHAHDPWSHEESNQGHGEGASLRYGTPVLMRSAYGMPNLVMDDQMFLKSLIGIQDPCGHTSSPSQSHHKRSHKLIKTLVDIYAACGDVSTSGQLELEVKLGEVPAFFGTCPMQCQQAWLDQPMSLSIAPGVEP